MLNDLQRRVLQWIADGCPDGAFKGYEHRVSAAALRTRGLVTISGRGPAWVAEITPAGQAALLEGSQVPDTTERVLAQPAQPKRDPDRPKRALSPTDQLIADVLAAGGVLRVPAWRQQGEPDYRQRVVSAQRFGKVPPGKRLEIGWVGGETEIRLVDAPPGTSIDPSPVVVPQRLSRPHPVARQFRDAAERNEVSRAALPRAVRIVHALATEAEQRGFQVAIAPASTRQERKGWSATHDGHLMITIRDHRYRLRIAEEKVKTRGPWEAEAKRLAEYPYVAMRQRLGRYDADATGRLVITLDSGHGRQGRPASWADRKSWTLEDKLPQLLQELEIRAAEDDQRDLEAKRRAEERQQNWEHAVTRAKERFLETHRADALRHQITDWETAHAATGYLAALEAEYGENDEAQPWIEWIRGYINRLNPLSSAPTLPEKAEISPEELKPFLGGASPYGPSGW